MLVVIRMTTSMGLIDYDRDGIEIGVRYGGGEYPDLVVEPLLSHDILPVCSPRLLSGGRKLEKPEDLAQFTLLHDDGHRHVEMFPDWGMWLKAAGVTNVDASHGLRFDNASAAQGAAVEGLGVALGRTTLISDDLAAGRLICPLDLTLHSDFAYWVVYPENRIKRPKVAAFRDWLVEEARRYQAEQDAAKSA